MMSVAPWEFWYEELDRFDAAPGDVVFVAARSPMWPSVRERHLLLNPSCVACGTLVRREVHHVLPFYVAPHLELVPGNLMTLCRPHHFRIGHDSDGPGPLPPCWISWNVHARVMARDYYLRLLG